MSAIKLPRRLDLSVQYACNRDGVPSRVDFRRWLRAAEPGAARVTVRIVDEEEGRALNRRVEISLVPQASACLIPGKHMAPSQDDGASLHNGE